MKMFINRKHTATHTLSLIASLALAFTSCVQLGEEQEGAYGYLTISGFDVDVQVEQLLPTKEGETVDISTVPGYDPPTLSSVTVTSASDKDKSYPWKNGEANLKLPAGTYLLSATSGGNGFGKPYYVGTGTAKVVAGQEATGTVEFSLGNSVMKVTNGMPEHFTVTDGTTVTISSGDKSVQTTMTENVTGYVFVPSAKNLTVEVTGNNTAGGTSKGYNIEIGDVAAGYAHNVILSVAGVLPVITFTESNVVAWGNAIFITSPATISSGNVDMSKVTYKARVKGETDWKHTANNNIISGLEPGETYEVMASVGALSSTPFTPSVVNVKASAKHTDTNGEGTAGGDLDGTDISIDASSLPDKVKDDCSFTLYDANKNVIHTFTTLTFDGSNATDGWPYLPQGDYTLEATATIDGVNVSSMSDIKVPAPSFTVTSGAYTSYSKYLKGDSNTANQCNAETIYDLQVASPNIVSSLLNNSNYKKSTTCSILLDDSANSSQKVENLSWGQHVVKASYTFDNTTCSSEYTLHITGLPYTAAPPTNKGDHKWTSNQQGGLNYVRWETNYVQLEGISIKQSIKSSEFHTPSDISVNFNINVDMRSYAVWPGKAIAELSCAVSGNEVIHQDGPSVGAYDDQTKNYKLSGKGILQNSAPYVEIANNYTMSAAYINIYSVNLVYN